MIGPSKSWTKLSKLLFCVTVLFLALILLPIRSYAAPLLRMGSRGDEVAALQTALLDAGFNPGPVDGIFGAKTLSALKEFQAAAGIAVDGICGPITQDALSRWQGTSRSTGRLRGKTVVLDPGHGGQEPGALSPWGDKEKNFTLSIASKVRYYLETQGANVIMTRYGDYSPGSDWGYWVDELVARASIANSNAADIFVSVHINAYPQDPTVSGVMGFYRRGSWSSQSLASTIAQCVAGTTGLRYIDTQVGPYYVLNHTYMPAALVEVGFMTNWNDVNLLRQNWFLDQVAIGISQGIADYLTR